VTELLPSPAQLAVFATAVLVLNATPGVDFLLTVSRTLQGGARAGVAAALGITAGCVAHILAAAFGLAALLAVHRGAFMFIQWAGAAYLVWLGVGMLRQAWRKPSPASTAQAGSAAEPAAGSFGADFRRGVLTNLLNPKVALFFLAFLPQFVPATSPHPTGSFLLLGVWSLVQGLLFLLLLVLLAAQLQRLGTGGPLARVLNALGGLLFLALALRILRERPAGV
jgi:threonine/homoserine/homoserine lactone efflux protein